MPADIAERKADHLELCATGDVGFQRKTTLLEAVELVHDALPELSLEQVDLSVRVLGKVLRAPIFVGAMTGGTERACEVNRVLASIAEARGYGFALGSQRAMLEGERVHTYAVRDVAPSALVLGNIGGVQARRVPTDTIRQMCETVGVDAIAVHLNPAMEIVQPGGDRDFVGVLGAIARLVEDLNLPVVVKETGCGLGPRTMKRLVRAGVRHVDVSGAGGTSWVAVETERARGDDRDLGTTLREWGIPTAAAVAGARAARPRLRTIIAGGGIATGLEAAKAIALGAHAVAVARPVLRALVAGGRLAVERYFDRMEAELRAAALLVGAPSVATLRKTPVIVRGALREWLAPSPLG